MTCLDSKLGCFQHGSGWPAIASFLPNAPDESVFKSQIKLREFSKNYLGDICTVLNICSIIYQIVNYVLCNMLLNLRKINYLSGNYCDQ